MVVVSTPQACCRAPQTRAQLAIEVVIEAAKEADRRIQLVGAQWRELVVVRERRASFCDRSNVKRSGVGCEACSQLALLIAHHATARGRTDVRRIATGHEPLCARARRSAASTIRVTHAHARQPRS